MRQPMARAASADQRGDDDEDDPAPRPSGAREGVSRTAHGPLRERGSWLSRLPGEGGASAVPTLIRGANASHTRSKPRANLDPVVGGPADRRVFFRGVLLPHTVPAARPPAARGSSAPGRVPLA